MSVAFIASNSLDIPFYFSHLMKAKRRAAEIFFLIDW